MDRMRENKNVDEVAKKNLILVMKNATYFRLHEGGREEMRMSFIEGFVRSHGINHTWAPIAASAVQTIQIRSSKRDLLLESIMTKPLRSLPAIHNTSAYHTKSSIAEVEDLVLLSKE